MKKKGWYVFFVSLFAGLVVCLAYLFVTQLPVMAFASPASASDAPQTSDYKLLTWNDLGMHCYNSDFSDLAVLPPYNTL